MQLKSDRTRKAAGRGFGLVGLAVIVLAGLSAPPAAGAAQQKAAPDQAAAPGQKAAHDQKIVHDQIAARDQRTVPDQKAAQDQQVAHDQRAAPQAQRANPVDSPQNWRWQTVARGLDRPWGLAFVPGGGFLVTERNGGLRYITAKGQVEPPISGLPDVAQVGQGGLLDVVLDEDFANNRRVYLCYAEAAPSGLNGTALAVGELSQNHRRLNRVQVLFSQKPKVASSLHFGCRIVLHGEHVYLTLGDRYSEMARAQSLDNHLGKVVRLNRDGSVPADNPFSHRAGALPEIYSYGHRNLQGATLGPDGRLWTHEHGPQGGDEINIIQPGANYGWPVITYGEQYGGGPIGEGITHKAGMEQPLYYWLPSIAPSGMSFVQGKRYGADWQGNLLVGSLKFGYLGRLVLDRAGRVVREEKIMVDERVRDVRESPDGFIYVLTDNTDGRLLRLLPGKAPRGATP